MEHGHLVVEGPHDVEFVGRLLKMADLSRVKFRKDLDSYWHPILPTTWPINDDLLKRVAVPVFFQGPTHSLAVSSAGGDSRIAEDIEEMLSRLKDPHAIGALLDADEKHDPKTRFSSFVQSLGKRLPHLAMPVEPGCVSGTKPRAGIYVLPDNANQGALEDLLVDCAEHFAPSLLGHARAFVSNAEPDFEEKKHSSRKKALVGCISNVYKPAKSIQTSIQDNNWVSQDTVRLPRIAAFDSFLKNLFNL